MLGLACIQSSRFHVFAPFSRRGAGPE
jgi:hypothetical protein